MSVLKYNKHVADGAKTNTTIAEGQLVGFDSSGNLVVALKTQSAYVVAVGVALHSGVSGDYIAYSPIAKVNGFTSLTKGGACYLSTAGGVTQTRPTTAGDLIQAVGVAIDDKTVMMNVVASGILAQASGSTTLG